MTPAITLYDIASSLNPQAWSPNTWKARLVLNYKHIPYKTEWISLPDIAPLVKKLGCSHTRMRGDEPIYTLPVIVDNSGDTPVVVCESLEIAKYLDAKFPDRPVLPKKGIALELAFEVCLTELVLQHFIPVLTPLTWSILDDRGKVYYQESRKRWYGKSIEDMSAEEHTPHWRAIEQGFDKLSSLLDKNGPATEFVAGASEPTRADMILIAFIAYIKAVAPEEGWKDRLQNRNGGRWQRLWDKSEEWRAVH